MRVNHAHYGIYQGPHGTCRTRAELARVRVVRLTAKLASLEHALRSSSPVSDTARLKRQIAANRKTLERWATEALS